MKTIAQGQGRIARLADRLADKAIRNRMEAEGQIPRFCYCISYPHVGLYKYCAPIGGGCTSCSYSGPC